jgi:hypothetical protein
VDFGQVELNVSDGGGAGLVLRSLYFINPRIAVRAVGQYLTLTQLIEHTGPTLETLRIISLCRAMTYLNTGHGTDAPPTP